MTDTLPPDFDPDHPYTAAPAQTAEPPAPEVPGRDAPYIDPRLLVEAGLGWERFRDITNDHWIWHDREGHTQYVLPDFSHYLGMCAELIRRLPAELTFSIFFGDGMWHAHLTWGVGYEKEIVASASSPMIEFAIATLFTVYYRWMKRSESA